VDFVKKWEEGVQWHLPTGYDKVLVLLAVIRGMASDKLVSLMVLEYRSIVKRCPPPSFSDFYTCRVLCSRGTCFCAEGLQGKLDKRVTVLEYPAV